CDARHHDRHGRLLAQAKCGGVLMALDTYAITTGRTGRPRRAAKRLNGWHLVLAPIALIFVLPFVQMILASLSPAKDLVKFPPPFIPSRLTLDGFIGLFTKTDILL